MAYPKYVKDLDYDIILKLNDEKTEYENIEANRCYTIEEYKLYKHTFEKSTKEKYEDCVSIKSREHLGFNASLNEDEWNKIIRILKDNKENDLIKLIKLQIND